MGIPRKSLSSKVASIIFNTFMSTILVIGLLAVPNSPAAAATQIDIPGPPGSGQFGFSITVLPNGNIVVCDPYFDDGPNADVGAVYLYDGASGNLVSTITGSLPDDQVGSGGVTVLANGNYVVSSPEWDGADINFGAVTWADGTSGVSGMVSAANSLVGSNAFDYVGSSVTALVNGNYVVGSPEWNNGGDIDVGAATWGDGTKGVTGTVSAANSLVGSTSLDNVGLSITALANGNYVIGSPEWANGAGAATWGDGTTGMTGTASAANSLVGSTFYDNIGLSVTALANGNYVVVSPYWGNGEALFAGSVTWGDGTQGVTGMVSAANSLVGSTAADYVGLSVTALANGNYVVSSQHWDNGVIENAGAATWGDGTQGVTGVVSETNSLVGSTANDWVGYSVTELANGNYVVGSLSWDNGAGAATWGDGTKGVTGTVSAANSLVGSTTCSQVGYHITVLANGNYVVSSPTCSNGTAIGAGAVTWGDGTQGVTGTISVDNSLVGSTTYDHIGHSITALANGNYVVGSPYWDNGAIEDAGAATWGDGTQGVIGTISVANSLVGSTTEDRVGYPVTALVNGNYVVSSPEWDNAGVENAGAVTWGDGTSGISGAVSAANSLVGSTAGDWVGSQVTALTNGNYVVSSSVWDNGVVTNAGGATWSSGTSGTSGVVSAANSLVGSTVDDWVGSGGVMALPSGNYVVSSPYWDNGAIVNAGAVTWGEGSPGSFGPITSENSVRGTADDGGEFMNFGYDDFNEQLVVGRPYDNIVTLFRPNRAPLADAGPDQSVKSQATATLDGSASHDPDSDLPLAYGWTQSGGTAVTLSSTTAISPTFTAPAVVTQTSTLTFTLVVTDSLGMSSLPDEVVISVEPYSALMPLILKQK